LIRLKQLGVDHLSGVPGDFVLALLEQVSRSDVRYTEAARAWLASRGLSADDLERRARRAARSPPN